MSVGAKSLVRQPRRRLTYIEGHPRYRLVLRNLGALHQLERELLIVKRDSEDGTRRGPGANHEVVDGHLGGC